MTIRTTVKRAAQACLVVAATAMLAVGCGERRDRGDRIVVGGKDFTEQYLLAELARILLEQEGFDVVLRTGVSSPIIRDSLLNDQVDLYYEYTGTAYTVFHEQSDPEIMRNPDRVYAWVKERDADNALVWLDPVRFNNVYTLMMRQERATDLGIETLSDLAAHVNENPDALLFAVGVEFWERPDGFRELADRYDLRFPDDQVRKMDIGLTYMALRDGQVDVAMGFNTDGRIAAFGFVSLDDDKGFFPVYNPAPVIREPVLDAHPGIREILKPLAENLTTDDMRELNATVDIERRSAQHVARDWLMDRGLVDGPDTE